jgi:hypothetical protein
MKVAAENLAETLFSMFLASGADATSDEFQDMVASVEIVGEDERDVIEALGRLHDMVADWQRRRH